MKKYAKRAMAGFLAMVLMAGALTGCRGGVNSTSSKAPEKVTIGLSSEPSPHIAAQVKGYFEECFGDGVEVEVVNFAASRDIIQAMTAGELDMTYCGCVAAVAGLANGLKAKVIWVDTGLGKVEAVAVREDSGIDSLEDLKGRKVAVTFVSTTHYILEYGLRKLREQGVDTSDVELLDMVPDEIYAAWTRGDIDAAVVWDPVLSKLEGRKLIYSGEDVAADSCPVTNISLVRDEFAEEYPEYVEKYLEALEKANQLYLSDEPELISTLAEGLEISEEEAAQQMEGIDWVTAEEQMSQQYFGGGFVDNLMGVAEYLYEGGNLFEEPKRELIENALDSSYIEKMLEK